MLPGLMALPGFPSFLTLSLTGISPNAVLAYLIMSWHLHLRRPRLIYEGVFMRKTTTAKDQLWLT